MKSEFFEEWFKEILLRDIEKLEKRVLIVMDNARFHRKNILEGNGALSIISSAVFAEFKSK